MKEKVSAFKIILILFIPSPIAFAFLRNLIPSIPLIPSKFSIFHSQQSRLHDGLGLVV